ncbi:venom dipeptidyl peptidase 4-like isoform X2 [Choristoneura fumiferana]|uniref:venom dipeptidyl peptidase 4-like isoform X2 n=1 Tax=Choristoneura fumiferana TaxID=7141 RepID=UPI003D154E09
MTDTLPVLILGLLFLGCPRGSAPQAVLKTFTLEELIPLKVDFYPDKLFGEWISDSEFVSKDGAGMVKYDAATQSKETLISHADCYNLSTNGYSVSALSKDLKYLLLTSQVMKVYRYSRIAVYSVYDLESKSINKIGKGPLQAAVWGKGRSLAYIQNNNVYYVPDVTLPAVTTLTTEGVLGEVYFGVADWIYEEEILNAAEALWFSPHGTSLAVAYFNDTLVESASYPIYGDPFDPMNQYPETMSFKYPKAGRVNPMVGLKVFKLGNPSSEARIIPAPVDVIGLDHILGRVSWASDQNLIVLWLNRRQNISILVNCDLTKDKCNLLQQQTEPNGWIDINEPFFDSTGNKMLDIQHMYSGERRFPHATIFNFNTSETEDLSPGNLTVTEILGWNEEKNTVYFIVSPGNLPWQRQLWSSTGGAMRCVSCQQPSCSNVDPMFSPGASFGILSCSSTNVPPKVFLYTAQTDSFKLLKDNFKLSEKFSKYNLPMALFNTISLGDDVMANVKLLLPPVIEKGQKYPMVVRVYAGPGTSRVKDFFDYSEYYNTYLAANRSFIVASIDVRGSKVLGVEAMHAVNNALGTVEVTDTLDAIRILETKYSFIDPKRVGVWGWSYGGFTTTMMLAKDDQNTIACGAAVAPVTSWLYYDSIYTERFMDLPQLNPTGYRNSDLMSMAETLRGRKYLLVHGSGDDNVHFQHSMQLAKELQHADIEFEQVSYTDENHSLRGVSRHFYHTLDRFWTHCFYP